MSRSCEAEERWTLAREVDGHGRGFGFESAPRKPILEVCLQGIDSALAAEAGGADRIELCEDLASGGVTPSAGVIAVACERLSIPVHVLIRPRGGDFVYSPSELAVIERDIAAARALGAAGVVVGLLTPERTIDVAATARLIAIARPLSVTFHKAFDEVGEPAVALDDLAALGIDRLLTSGQAPSALAGGSLLASLQRRAGARIIVMAGGRITEPDLAPLLALGLNEIHVGSAVRGESRTDARKVRRFADHLRALTTGAESHTDSDPS